MPILEKFINESSIEQAALLGRLLALLGLLLLGAATREAASRAIPMRVPAVTIAPTLGLQRLNAQWTKSRFDYATDQLIVGSQLADGYSHLH